MTFSIRRPLLERSERPRAVTTPAVTVAWKPNGLPMAMTIWPGLQPVGVAELGGGQPADRRLDDGQVGRRVVADQPRRQRAAIGERHFQALHVVDDVAVGEDVAVRRDDDARAAAGHGVDALAVGALRGDVLLAGDVDDRGADPLRDGDDGRGVGVEHRLGFIGGKGKRLRRRGCRMDLR